MKALGLIGGLVLAGLLVFVIDAQSRVPVRHADLPLEPPRVFAVGRVEGATEEIELRPQIAGLVRSIPVYEGQMVEAGQMLVQLDDDQYRCEVAQAEAELAQAQAQLERLLAGARAEERREASARYRAKLAELERAELAWKRARELRQSHAISPQEADERRTAVAALTAEVEAAKAAVELIEAPPRQDEVRLHQARVAAAQARLGLAKVMLQRCQLRAPMRAQVLKIDIRPGELAGPTLARPAIILADTSRWRVRAFVEELDAPRVQIGAPATVTADGLPGRTFRGTVSRSSPRMDRKELWSYHPAERFDTKTREVWIDLDDATDLVVGLRVDVVIDLATPRPSAENTSP